ncbi:hypothetical protein P279_28965 [Rhodobacteraceae bacterium PD-2]|nr:hypothetical protein P279_28965 [Rhodobacteraceae bacterium PD-2]
MNSATIFNFRRGLPAVFHVRRFIIVGPAHLGGFLLRTPMHGPQIHVLKAALPLWHMSSKHRHRQAPRRVSAQ